MDQGVATPWMDDGTSVVGTLVPCQVRTHTVVCVRTFNVGGSMLLILSTLCMVNVVFALDSSFTLKTRKSFFIQKPINVNKNTYCFLTL